ncbi:MAG: hypothetical protein P1U40_11875 [Coxiellaceae bacterium]|nr:hypothetical protein [Coxiellaceae bacterium]
MYVLMRDVFELRFLTTAAKVIEKTLAETAGRRIDGAVAATDGGETKASEDSLPIGDTPATAQDVSAARIQHAWQLSRLRNALTKNGHTTYTSNFPDSLHHAMAGRTIATTSPGDFPLLHPEAANVADYHRDNVLWSEHYQATLLAKLLASQGITPAEGQAYIPIRKSAHIPPEKVLARCRLTEYSTTVYEDDRIVVISCPSERYHHDSPSTEALFRLGLQASQWDIATSAYAPTPHAECKSGDYNAVRTVHDFKHSPLVKQLRLLSLDESLPTHPLLLALHQLIINLPDRFHDQQQSIGRLEAALPALLQAKKMNYKSMSYAIYLVLHEFALQSAENIAYKAPTTPFLQMVTQNILVAKQQLGYDDEEFNAHENLKCISTLTNSGATAFAIGFDLAHKMLGTRHSPPSSQATSPLYFEFAPYYNNNPLRRAYYASDIYLANLSPLIGDNSIYTMQPLNEALSDIFAAHGYPKETPISIVVDATANKGGTLALCPEYRKLIDDGLLNLIITRSHQKFGLLHADSVQGGEVTVFCSNTSFPAETIAAFNHASETDYNSSIDQQTLAYIQTHCAESLEMITERHYDNGRSLYEAMQTFRLQSHYDVRGHTPEDNLFVNTNEDFKPALFKAAGELLPERDSYGFANTTYSYISSNRRISPGASDSIDMTIDNMKLYFATVFTRPGDHVQPSTPPLKTVLLQLIKQPGDWTPAQQIAVLALLRSHTQRLLKKTRHLSKHDCSDILLVAKKLQQQGELLRGRTEMQLLLADVYTIKAAMRRTIPTRNLAAYLQAIDTCIKAGYETEKILHRPHTRAAISLVYAHDGTLLTKETYDKITTDKNFATQTTKLFEIAIEFVPAFLTNGQMQQAISLLLSAELDSEIDAITLSIVFEPFNQNILAALHRYASQPLSDIDKTALRNLTRSLVDTMLTVSNTTDRREEIKQSMTSWAQEKKPRLRVFASPSSKRKACLADTEISLVDHRTEEKPLAPSARLG